MTTESISAIGRSARALCLLLCALALSACANAQQNPVPTHDRSHRVSCDLAMVAGALAGAVLSGCADAHRDPPMVTLKTADGGVMYVMNDPVMLRHAQCVIAVNAVVGVGDPSMSPEDLGKKYAVCDPILAESTGNQSVLTIAAFCLSCVVITYLVLTSWLPTSNSTRGAQ